MMWTSLTICLQWTVWCSYPLHCWMHIIWLVFKCRKPKMKSKSQKSSQAISVSGIYILLSNRIIKPKLMTKTFLCRRNLKTKQQIETIITAETQHWPPDSLNSSIIQRGKHSLYSIFKVDGLSCSLITRALAGSSPRTCSRISDQIFHTPASVVQVSSTSFWTNFTICSLWPSA